MPMTEDDLRTALRSIPASLPPAPDRLGGIEHRVRRHRRRVVASVAAGVAAVLLAVPVVRLVSDSRQRDALPVGTTEQQVRDAEMKYATFVAFWDGMAFTRKLGTDAGVEGVEVTSTLPPYYCTIARPATGEPGGTQAAWVLGAGSVIPQPGENSVLGSVGMTQALWTPGATTCDPRPADAQLYAAAPDSAGNPLGAEVTLVQSLADPSKPALDVAAVYRRIPADRVTDHGREVFADYQKWLAGIDFGTPEEQNKRALHALLDWLSIAMVSTTLTPSSPVEGPELLRSTDYVGTAQLPEGFTARWDGKTLCVDGSVNGSPVQHATNGSYDEPGGIFSLYDGPCRS
ncbi:MAG: hypothetical protein U0R68_07675 [Candidatus Nanopelagicales bacterium]